MSIIAPRAPAPDRCVGIDVSLWQGDIRWDSLPPWVSFAIIKASERAFIDRRFAANWSGAKRASLVRGAYHLVHMEADAPAPAEQADAFIDAVSPAMGDMLCLDVETSRIDAAPDPSRALTCILAWLRRVEAVTGALPIIYISPRGMRRFGGLDTSPLERYPLWHVQWPGAEPAEGQVPKLPAPWGGWTFWQWTDKGPGKVIGDSNGLDLNYFNGSRDDLLDFAWTSGASALPPKTPPSPDPVQPPVDVAAAVDYNARRTYTDAQWGGIVHGVGFNPFDHAQAIAAVAEFQARNHLGVDGKIGPQTLRALGVS